MNAPITIATLMMEIVVSAQTLLAIPVIVKKLRMILATKSAGLFIVILTTVHEESFEI